MPHGEEPDIFEHNGYRPYLIAWKAARPIRSYPWMASRLECTTALVHGVMTGKKPITPKRVPDWIRMLRLETGMEQEYFRLLVQWEHAPFAKDRDDALIAAERLRRLREGQPIGPSDLWVFDEWHHLAIYALARCRGFRADPAWIARTLAPPISEQAAAETLERLVARGLLAWTAAGELAPSSTDLVLDPAREPELYRARMAAYHRWWVERARGALAEFPAGIRDYRALTLAIPADRYATVVELLRACQDSILALCEREGEPGDRVYLANMQLFPLSEDTREARVE